jgi:hypothetical protein
MVLPYSVFLVLGTAAPARAVAHNSYSRLYEYGSTALLSGLWRQAIEVGSRSGLDTYVSGKDESAYVRTSPCGHH